MNKKQIWLIILVCTLNCLINFHSFSFSAYEDEYGEDYYKYVEPIKTPESSIAWEIFALTEAKSGCSIDEEGFDYCITEPIYAQKVKDLDDKMIEITGYMFPLQPAEAQTNFLIGPYPLSCPFHYHSKPNQVIEVIAKKAISFSYDPITIKGKLSLDFDPDKGSFYYLHIE